MGSIGQKKSPYENLHTVGVDIGASSCKAIVFDASGKTKGKAQREHPKNTPNPGWVELDTKQWWNTVAGTIRQAISESNVPPEDIKALGVSSETDGVVPVDDDGEPLRPYIHWSDTRCYPQYDWILSHANIDEIYSITGIPLHKSWWSPPGLKMLWIRENDPEIFAKTKRFLQIGNYVLYKLTGKYLTDYSVAARTMLFDIQKLEWSERMAALLDIPLSTQPALSKSAEITGRVTEDAAEQTGLSTSTQVVTGGGDTECSALGAGMTSEGQALVSIGTSLMIIIAREKPTFVPDRKDRELSGTGMFSSCHVIDNIWLLEAGSMAGAVLAWFKDEFGHLEEKLASNLGISAYDVLGTEAKSSTPGPNSPVFVIPKNAIFNLTIEHKRSDLIRSILEAVAFEAQQIIEAAENSGISVRTIIMVGGGAKSDLWRQIVADVTNRPIRSPDMSETGAFGAAVLAGLGTGLYDSLGHVPRGGTHFENTPNAETHEAYKTLYRKYKALYELLGA